MSSDTVQTTNKRSKSNYGFGKMVSLILCESLGFVEVLRCEIFLLKLWNNLILGNFHVGLVLQHREISERGQSNDYK